MKQQQPTQSEAGLVLPETSRFLAADRRIEVRLNQAAEEVSAGLIQSTESYSVAIAQISSYPGQIELNTEKIIASINEAKRRGAELIVFPELTVPGYTTIDLIFDRSYVQNNVLALEKIRQATEGITAIVGYVRPEPGVTMPGGRPLLYNSAAVLRDGKIVAVQDKSLLPVYDIFDESRYFAPGKSRQVIEVGGRKLGIEICEDLWSEGYNTDPTAELAAKGADIIVSLNASPFHVGKLPVRAGLIERATSKHNLPFIYTNLVGSYDGYEGEVVFDGRSIVMGPQGKLLGLGQAFKEELLLVDIHKPKELTLPNISEIEELHEALVLGIRDWFYRAGRALGKEPKQAILGLSGGIDSAVVAALAAEALGPDRVLGISMPTNYNSTETKSDAERTAEALGIRFKTVPIQRCVDTFLEEMRLDPDIANLPEDVSEENVQARERMKVLTFYGNKLGGTVLNTGNKTELALDNFTMYGDSCGFLSVLGDVEKDRVYALARFINERAGRELIPQSTIDRVPSAELKEGQADADVMGADPQAISPLTRALVEENLSASELQSRFSGKYSAEVISNAYTRLHNGELKRRQIPGAIRVTPHAFGFGRRYPINHGYKG